MHAIKRLFRFEQTSALLMIAALIGALAAANSPLAPLYQLVHHLPVHLQFGPLVIEEPLVQWINEGLMVFFFLVVGLEIKRETLEGHLATRKSAILPALAALGGMIVPAAIYAAFNWGDPERIRGWAIPTATDIVLALGILSLLGRRVPTALKVFLTALAIFDDIGAVLIIGLFYAEELHAIPLLLAGLGAVGLALLNRLHMTGATPITVVGLFLWITMLESGLEASLAGILIAVAIPLRDPEYPGRSPLRITERRLHPWAVLLIVPLFAFFNAGIPIDVGSASSLWTTTSLGIVLGLFVGKQVGVFGAVLLAVRSGVGQIPQGVTWLQIYGSSLLAGIGFTMSLFISSLAFPESASATAAKLAILLGSLVSAGAGAALIHLATRGFRPADSACPAELPAP